MGLDVYLFQIADDGCDDIDKCERVDLPSALYPEHGFRVGYFRSPYKPHGIDRVMRERIGTDISGIMGRSEGETVTIPDWKKSHERSLDAYRKLVSTIERVPQIEFVMWYLQAICIMTETCEWVMSKPDPERYALHWSE